ncbi:MAG: TerB family tellurite resistance protein [Sphingobacteriales bacterium]|nr:TerB family tellurite resistance protein [Sphingobacteriales bacterium]OJW00108.1 MAG: hypothetical protein BGO52_03195 [Sphingobacteriales bacterium 44-61]
MKKWGLIMVLLLGSIWRGRTQSFEVQQLLLNVEKLAQFKQILADLKKGYEIVAKGYTTIRDISEGNFSLHDAFLDALWQVSPAVRQYKRTADIIALQLRLVKEYKAAWQRTKSSSLFSPNELEHIEKVYSNLFQASLRNLEDLLLVITARQLRMSDDERLTAIDRIYASMQDKIVFLRQFNSSNTVLGVQRMKEQQDVNQVRKFYDLP